MTEAGPLGTPFPDALAVGFWMQTGSGHKPASSSCVHPGMSHRRSYFCSWAQPWSMVTGFFGSEAFVQWQRQLPASWVTAAQHLLEVTEASNF